jgi:CelD/BcsL family acetyltransferase involved in cellulose biosynthesis
MSAAELRGDLVADVDALAAVEADWDRLAVERGRPYSAPAWMLSWWRNAAPAGSALRVVVVREGGAVRGIGPFYAAGGPRGAHRTLGVGGFREPLAAVGVETRVARAVAAALAAAEPAPASVSLEAVPSGSAWAEELAEAWPAGRRPRIAVERTERAPRLELAGSFDDWFAGRSANFRSQMRRYRRQLDDRGGVLRQAGTDELDHALEALARLHYGRWAGRGGSAALSPQVERMLLEAAARLPADRFRLWTIELDGEIVSVDAFVAAGGVVSFWLGGHDPRVAAQRPTLITLVAAVEQAYALGDRWLDLGLGDQEYKHRFADGAEELAWPTLVPAGRGSVRVRSRIAAGRIRRGLADRLPERQRVRARRALRAVRRRS